MLRDFAAEVARRAGALWAARPPDVRARARAARASWTSRAPACSEEAASACARRSAPCPRAAPSAARQTSPACQPPRPPPAPCTWRGNRFKKLSPEAAGGGGTPLHAPVHRVAYGRSLPTHRCPLREGRMTAIVGSPLGGCKGRELQLRVLKTCCPPRALATRLGQSRASLLGASALLLLRLVPGVPEVLRAGLARVVRRVARVPAAIAERGLPRAPHGAASTHGG